MPAAPSRHKRRSTTASRTNARANMSLCRQRSLKQPVNAAHTTNRQMPRYGGLSAITAAHEKTTVVRRYNIATAAQNGDDKHTPWRCHE
ncbi:hypothetical protein AVEN_22047-1 [Araneus ventricosus]|uniref:Uncharacterized protein n=1 Tax=Araneus ventricosus TaxID=182803 RepID=A0A4Y2VUJ3_ARAVE|nr:hypothetical protein AVEN_22047-1 [Araneus ventricosus]